ncbi:acyltransferase family protein [Paenochrobactrum sp. BZR 201-1]
MSQNNYVPFIDGLRAIAVISVVGYHAGLPVITGGFVGVDVFLVISGFLIINQIVSGLDKGNFSFKTFWARRALRILPSYLLVILVSCIIASFVLVTPSEFEDFGNQVIYSALMIVNHYFLDQQGYFDSSSTLKPLLHLWSLAVEEQFYLVAPIILVGLAAIAHRFSILSKFLVLLVFVLSLSGSIWLTEANDDKNYAFFLMPLRAWEFMVGGALVLAVPYVSRLPRILTNVLSIAALVALVLSIILISSERPWPSFYALFPVLATATLIACGLADRGILVSRMLSIKPFLWIGLVSYAWYLWHWPLIVFARIYNFETLTIGTGLLMAAMSFVLACLTYWFIEKPIKEWRQKTKCDRSWKPTIVGGAVCASIAIIGTSSLGSLTQILAVPTVQAETFSRGGVCELQSENAKDNCLNEGNLEQYGLLFGDSYALRAYDTLSQFTQNNAAPSRLTSLISTSCLPLFDTDTFVRRKVREKCRTEFTLGKDIIGTSEVPVSYAILIGRWTSAIANVDGKKLSLRSLGPAGAAKPEKDQIKAIETQLLHTIDTLYNKGLTRILIVMPTPEFPTPAEACITRARKYFADIDKICSVTRAEAEHTRAPSVTALDNVLKARPNVRVIDPLPAFCDESTCRGYSPETKEILFSDKVHLTTAGVQKLFKAHQDEFSWAAGEIAEK